MKSTSPQGPLDVQSEAQTALSSEELGGVKGLDAHQLLDRDGIWLQG